MGIIPDARGGWQTRGGAGTTSRTRPYHYYFFVRSTPPAGGTELLRQDSPLSSWFWRASGSSAQTLLHRLMALSRAQRAPEAGRVDLFTAMRTRGVAVRGVHEGGPAACCGPRGSYHAHGGTLPRRRRAGASCRER